MSTPVGPRGASIRGSSASTGASSGGAFALRSFSYRARARPSLRALSARARRPELAGLMLLAGALNLWALSRNGVANEYYTAAVRSMSTSWHDFLFASFDKSGLMTVDKPPLALWIQALSVRVFGYHSLSMLVPQALEGIASVVLTYDLVRRRFGRIGGTAAGVALALTPMTVAVSRHNNPDALLALCCVAAVWFAVRGLEDGRTRWFVLAGVAVGLGFETKMLVALAVVPGIAAAWIWMAPTALRGARVVRKLLASGAALLVVGGAWPLLVELTPASDRPWIAGTNDNSVLSLIFGYNGLGRVEGQSGGPGGAGGPGGGGGLFGGTPGPLRLLNSALGGQASWLLGFAIVSAAGLLLATRLRRRDARSGWLIAVGGAALTTAVLFSIASGIFHPYYVSLLAPFIAALAGAGVAQLMAAGESPNPRRRALILGPVAVLAGVACELVVLGDYPGQLEWLVPLLIVVGAASALALTGRSPIGRRRPRRHAALAAAFVALLLAPAIWSVDTLGHATSGTFPSGGPESAQFAEAPFGGRDRSEIGRRGLFGFGGPGGTGFPGSAGSSAGPSAGAPPFGPPAGGPRPGAPGASGREGGFAGAGPGAGAGADAAGGGAPGGAGSGGGVGQGGLGGPGGGEPFGGGGSLKNVLSYISAHGGGTLAVASQSSASSAIISQDANVAGIGGFSGRESSVGVAWLAQRVRSGAIRWVLAEETGSGPRLPGDTRAGSHSALSAVARACIAAKVPAGAAGSAAAGATAGETGATTTTTVYDCAGRAQALVDL
jgi:4-amino-4-deoxy-L-arabinose transferase-like glycosyltransferase